ncbi:MAG: glutamate--tRNA ligase [Gemmatimonadetes bacterium]|nr:glutamate--tRNA ligase [Gemmatimonadota bacterium]
MTATPVRVRFAPSPTGYLHVGGARTALFNWLFARQHGGVFLLRIEDTDKARSTEESTRAIFDGLRWLGLDWDEPVVYQGADENLARHQRDARAILDAGKAYRCFCTATELNERRAAAESRKESFRYDRRCDRLAADEVARRVAAGEPHTIRFRVPEGSTGWRDLVHDDIAFPNKDIEDFVILRSDGTPIYNLAVVSDDIAMRITHVMRGDDHISNTPKQILLYQALGAPLPVFAHFPMIHGMDGKKLSKRHGATAVGDYQHLGILPQAMCNFLALMGWSPGGDREVMTMAEMIALFSETGLLKKASVFDTKKLEWMNGQHLAMMPLDALAPDITARLVADGLATAAELDARHDRYLRALDALRTRVRSLNELASQLPTYLRLVYDPAVVRKAWPDAAAAAEIVAQARELVATQPWDPPAIEAALRAVAESRALGVGKVLGPVRMALTGSASSPGISEVLHILGKDEAVARLDQARAYLAGASA